jgi:IMP and pyridine-specific 5'-nucleotidase
MPIVNHQQVGTQNRSKLKLLVPSVANFFTPLALHDAFIWQDQRRFISMRRFVPPSFNDVRLILNTAQVMSLVRNGPLELVTFDGDVTLYDDGQCLTPENPVIPRILKLMRNGSKIGIVTAAGYTEAHKYYERLYGLLDAIYASDLPQSAKQGLIVMGGESNYCFRFDGGGPDMLKLVPKQEWLLKEMVLWEEADITALLDIAEASLRDTVKNMRMDATVVRKERAVGIIPQPGHKFCRETLEETVLIAQKILVCNLHSTSPGHNPTDKWITGNVRRRQPPPVLRVQRRQRCLRRHWRQVVGRARVPAVLRRHRGEQDAACRRPIPVRGGKRLQSTAGMHDGVDCEPRGDGAVAG